MKNILVIGRGTIAVNCLEELNRYKIPPKIIVCDVKDLGVNTWSKSLYKKAKELGYKEGVNLFRCNKINDVEFTRLIAIPIDIIFSFQARPIFRAPFINLAKDYVINLHFSPLPKLRGVAPCAWAFIDNMKKMGVTLHLIENGGIDNGPIIAQKMFHIFQGDTCWTLYNKCIEKGTLLFKRYLPKIVIKTIKPIKQDIKQMTYHPYGKLDFSSSEIQLNASSTLNVTYNFIRSRIFPPYQLPFFYYHNNKIEILALHKRQKNHIITQPEVCFRYNRFIIKFGEGELVIYKYILKKGNIDK